jgi:hypothetical protein
MKYSIIRLTAKRYLRGVASLLKDASTACGCDY